MSTRNTSSPDLFTASGGFPKQLKRQRQFVLNLHDKLIVDNFAGGGGASTGIWMALNRHADHAINHDLAALGMHRINHPQTVHHCEDVFDVDPRALTEGRPVGLAHFSPDCKHFSKAKGGKPLDKRIRGLVLVMLRWAEIRAEVMTMENVEEITTWCPLIQKKGTDGKMGWYPDMEHKGRTWEAFLKCLSTGIEADHPDLPEFLDVLCGEDSPQRAHWKNLLMRGFGYRYEHREIKAYHHGTRTIRNRLYMVARCDGRPILWEAPTHEDPKKITKGSKLKPWLPVADCIDWNLACPSIFYSKSEAKALGFNVKRPLVAATQRRIAKGIDRYVLKAKKPFLVSLTHQGGDRVEAIDEPIKTITGAHRGEKALVTPVVVNSANSKTTGRGPNVWPTEEPVRTLTSSPSFSLVTGTVVGAGGPEYSGKPTSVDKPFKAMTTENHSALASATLAPLLTEHANSSNQRNMPAGEPMRTACSQVKGGHFALVSGSLVHVAHGETDKDGNPRRGRGARGLDEPAPTLTTTKDAAIAAASIVKLRGTNIGSGVEEPMHTASAGGQHHGLVESETYPLPLTQEQRAGALRVAEFLRAHGVVFEGNFATLTDEKGQVWVIVDIGMRMLTPRELYRAQGFPEDYIIDKAWLINPATGALKETALTKEQQIRMCGNSVCPPVMASIVRANVPELIKPPEGGRRPRRTLVQHQAQYMNRVEA